MDHRRPEELIQKLATVLPSLDLAHFYANVLTVGLVREGSNVSRDLLEKMKALPITRALDDKEWLMAADTGLYLPDDILVKVDRASMGVSLEVRSPFLDQDLYEIVWRLPSSLKFREGIGKWCLRRILCRYVPPTLVNRPKSGFGVPIGNWLRGSLREWAEGLLDESTMREQGYLNAGLVREKWDEHLSGRRNRQNQLWNVLMFQAWMAEQAR